MLFPKPFAADILDSTAAGRALINNGASSSQFGVSGNTITITSPAADEAVLEFYNSATSGAGGRVLEIGSTIAGSTGTNPFVIGAVEFDVNDDSSRDFNVFMGHGYNSAGGLLAGSSWGASGIVFEQHYNPSAGVNQSETYFRLWSLQAGGTEYRPIGITHTRHDLSNGGDSINLAISGDETLVRSKTGATTFVTINSTNLTVASGLALTQGGGANVWNGATGRLVTTAIGHYFNPTITTDDDACAYMQPVVNLASSKTGRGVAMFPQWTGATGAAFVGYNCYALASKAITTNVGFQSDAGVNGSVTVGTAVGFRTNPQAYTGTVTTMIGFHAQAITSTGTVTNGYGVKIENHTGHHAFHSGTGRHQFGSASADTKIGFYGATPVTQQTGVAVSTAAIHAALVNLGLITA